MIATLALVLALVAPAAHGDARQPVVDRELLPGLRHQAFTQDGPDPAVHVARVAPGAPVDVRVVTAHDQIAGGPNGREPTSAMCDRAGGMVCINGDFAECPSCGQPIGAVVRRGRVLRSPHGHHEQLSVLGASAYSLDRLRWTGRLVATYRWPNEASAEQEVLGEDAGWRTETRTLSIDALNRTRADGSTVLFTPEWGPTTGAPGGYEALLVTPDGVRPGSMPVRLRGEAAGDAAIPVDGVVLSASGADEAALRRFVADHRGSDAPERSLVLETAVSPEVLESVGAHPVLLRDGKRQPLNDADNKVAVRHPRTLAGWTGEGELLLVTVDGRRSGHAAGMTLHEATDLLISLGARHAVNLDGGGASTFVGPCPSGRCVLNRPSDDRERHVTSAIVVVPHDRNARVASAPPAPPTPPAPAPAPVAPLVVESTAEPVVEASPPAPEPVEPAPAADPTPDPAPAIEPAAATGGEALEPSWPEMGAPQAAPSALRAPVAAPDIGGPASVAVVVLLGNVALAAALHRRRLQPLLARELSAARATVVRAHAALERAQADGWRRS